MLQGDDRVVMGNIVRVVSILLVIMFILIVAANFIA